MRFPSKELVIAVLIGFAVGLVVTYGIWSANKAIKQKEGSVSPVPTESRKAVMLDESEQVDNSSGLQLKIAQPEPYTLINLDRVSVSGITANNANVLVFGEKDWELVLADSQGQFNAEIQLISGVNYIKITAISDDGAQMSEHRTVVYSTTEI